MTKKVFYIYCNGYNVGQEERQVRALLRIEQLIKEDGAIMLPNKPHFTYEQNYIKVVDNTGKIYEATLEEIK